MPGKAVTKGHTKSKGKSSKDDDEPYVASKSGKAKKEKDPDAPKRPQSAYFLYCNERRPQLKKEKPELSMCDMTKELTKEWKELTEKQKKKYDDMQVKEKERYEKEMETYKGGKVTKKDEGGQKKQPNGYFVYQAERRD